MLIVSLSRSLLSPAPEDASRSDPAKSTAHQLISSQDEQGSLPRLSIASHFSSVRGLTPLTLRVKTEWDREERSFIRVAATARLELALSSNVDTDRGLLRGTTGQYCIPQSSPVGTHC
jgi:hypothetical protein